MLHVASRVQPDEAAPAGRDVGVVGRDLTELVAAVRVPEPPPGRRVGLACRAGDELDRLRDHERREQPDAELTEELLTPGAEVGVTLRGPADRREELDRLRAREPDAVVTDLERTVRARGEKDPAATLRGFHPRQQAARREGIDAVLEELTQVDARARVEMTGEQVDDAVEVDLERGPRVR